MDRVSSVSVLSRTSTFSMPRLTPLQVEVDGVASSFVSQATDWRNLAAFTAGGAAYRVGRLGVLGVGGTSPRLASLALGLGAEVSTYEITHRSLQNGAENPNLWRWSGRGGLAQGLLQSSVTFGTLRGAGSAVAGQNPILHTVIQDAAMVFGHQVSAPLGAAPRPSGSLAQQFLRAEATLSQGHARINMDTRPRSPVSGL